LNVGDVQDVIETAIGGENISNTVEGRRRFPIRVRYFRDYREDIDKLKMFLLPLVHQAHL
jgi:Cu(I)/Ag(I) efflux system membrane protein CusA/SilA